MVTRKDVAKLAGVSPATVSRFTSGRGYVSEEARKKISVAVAQLNYIPNNIAKSFSQSKSNVVAILVEDVTNPYYLQILESMEREGLKHNLIISLFAVNKDNMDMIVAGLIENRVCAIINLALFTCSPKYISILEELKIYTVCMNTQEQESFRIDLNHEQGIEALCRHLHEKGRKKLIYIAALGEVLSKQDARLAAYLKNRKKYGFVESDDYVVYGNYPEKRAFEVGYESAQKLYRDKVDFDSVFCMNDTVAIGLMKFFHEKNIRIPEDVCVIGCDNILIGKYTRPALTTIDVETEKQGIAYISAVVGKSEAKVEQINARLVLRDSTV